ncbi:MAG: coproporphyrinogen III oxidase, partial [Flavobacteriales bacterium]
LGFAQNEKSVKGYQEQVMNGELSVFRGHFLTEKDLLIRRHILDLMCSFETPWRKTELLDYSMIKDKLRPLEADGLCGISVNGLVVTESGKTFVRNICMCFDEYLENVSSKTPVFSKTI